MVVYIVSTRGHYDCDVEVKGFDSFEKAEAYATTIAKEYGLADGEDWECVDFDKVDISIDEVQVY